MKFRKGFVTNSSSSSFIVFFDKVPESVEELREMMFEGRNYFSGYYSDSTFSTVEIAHTVWEDMQEQNPNDLDKLIDVVDGGWIDEMEDIPYPNMDPREDREAYDKAWEDYEKATRALAEKYVEKYILNNANKAIYIFHYSDNDGAYYSTLEHGGVFDNLKHKRISHH